MLLMTHSEELTGIKQAEELPIQWLNRFSSTSLGISNLTGGSLEKLKKHPGRAGYLFNCYYFRKCCKILAGRINSGLKVRYPFYIPSCGKPLAICLNMGKSFISIYGILIF